MQVSVETIEGLGRRMRVTLPAEEIEQEVDKRLQNLARTVRLKGFRPGKVPLKVVRQQYGRRVRAEAIEELTRNSFFEAVSKENLRLSGYPVFEQGEVDEGKDYEYTATFDIEAEFDLAPLDDFEIERPGAEITDADVDAMIERLRRQSCDWQDVDRPAAMDDRLTIDFQGLIDGEPFDKGKAEGLSIVLGSGAFIPGFEDGLIGARAGDERSLDLTFPDDYHDADLAGKDVRFEIRVRRVEEPILPEVDEAFARLYEIEDGSIETLRSEVRRSMQSELDEAVRLRMRRQVMDQLYERHPIDLPHLQVQAQLDDYLSRHQGEVSEAQREKYETAARRFVTLGIVVSRIVREQRLRPDPLKVRARVESLAASYDDPDAVIAWYYGDRQRLAEVEAQVLEDAVVDWIIGQSRVKDVESSFDELVGSAG